MTKLTSTTILHKQLTAEARRAARAARVAATILLQLKLRSRGGCRS
jgi:hypothetical protein